MDRIKIDFDRDWINRRRDNGVRVVRSLEAWTRDFEGATVKSSSAVALELEVEPTKRDSFLEGLKAKFVELGGSNDWAHALFSGDVDGIDVPKQGRKSAPAPAESIDARQPAASSGEKIAKSDPADGEQERPDPAALLEEICANVPVRHSRELEAYMRNLSRVIPTAQKMGVADTIWHEHLLLAVDAGYGRSDLLKSIAQLLYAHGLVKEGVNEKTCREFILNASADERTDGYRESWDGVIAAAADMRERNLRKGISRAVLYIDISTWQDRLYSLEGQAYLRRLNAVCGNFLIVFRVPFLESHVLSEIAEGLNNVLNVTVVAVPPVAIDGMAEYARTELERKNFKLAENAYGALEQWILREKADDSFFGYKTMDKMVNRMIYQKAVANSASNSERPNREVDFEDLRGMLPGVTVTEGDPAFELSQLVGMKDVERRLREVIALIKTQRELKEKGSKVARPAIHMLFTGNPGTGKTTVARIAARLMKQEGILRKGHLVEVKGRDLCGQYIGETAPKTSAICRDAYGSVLFIDEAYSLFRDEYASSRDYGREALDTLVAEMENHRDDFCVIMAGYKDDMDAMLKGNAGLRSRIPYEIEFPNYTRDDLEQIFFSLMNNTFEYEDGLRDEVRNFIKSIPDEVLVSKEFSNARFVRNLYERTWGKAAYRRSLDHSAQLRILKSDLAGATGDKEFKQLLEKSVERKVVGFGI